MTTLFVTAEKAAEMAEYIDFKIEDEGLEGVVDHCLNYVAMFDSRLAHDIEEWASDERRLRNELLDAIRPHILGEET